jgi:hypothetical protein
VKPRSEWTKQEYAAHIAAVRADLGIDERPALLTLAEELRELERRPVRYDEVTPGRERIGWSA